MIDTQTDSQTDKQTYRGNDILNLANGSLPSVFANITFCALTAFDRQADTQTLKKTL